HGRAQPLRREQAAQHAPGPRPRADITLRPRPLAPGIDVFEDVLDEREVGPRAVPDGADEANSRLPRWLHVLLRAGPRVSHDLVAGKADLGVFLQGGRGYDAIGPQNDPVGLGHLDPQPGRLLVEPWRWYGQVLDRKAIVGGLGVQHGEGFPA